MASETHEQYLRRKQLREQSDDDRRWPAMRDEHNPDHWIYPMPTVEEVVAAGYEPDYHEHVARERAELVRRFQEDPVWRAAAIANMRAFRERFR